MVVGREIENFTSIATPKRHHRAVGGDLPLPFSLGKSSEINLGAAGFTGDIGKPFSIGGDFGKTEQADARDTGDDGKRFFVTTGHGNDHDFAKATLSALFEGNQVVAVAGPGHRIALPFARIDRCFRAHW